MTSVLGFRKTLLEICCIFWFLCDGHAESRRPNIIFIMADDLGWNDVGFHGLRQIPTPNIDALAYSGLILNNYYVTPICTPSRSALMTGKYPIRTGMQHGVLYGAEPRGLPLTEILMPQFLKDLGYSTHIVGKWHLGSYKKEYTPLYRGFESHLGYWTGHQDYYDHSAVERPGWGLDMRRNMDVAQDLHGQYSTDIFTNEAIRIINSQNITKPLFLFISHAAVHSANPYNPLPSPDSYVAKFTHIDHYNRRRFAGVLTKLDESVGKVVQALSNRKMLKDSIIVFTTDNGGPADGFNINAASNWPLRGVKNTLWEGGIRGAALLWSDSIKRPERVSLQTMHITDWLPTLYFAAGGDVKNLGNIDGFNLWEALSNDQISKRSEILHNIDDIYGNSALTIGDWKLLKGTTYNGVWDSWYGPSGRTGPYDFDAVLTSPAGKSLSAIDRAAKKDKMRTLRDEAEIKCFTEGEGDVIPCRPLQAACLFNIRQDPCEKRNLANTYPDILKSLENKLGLWNSSAVPPGNLPLDPRGDPRFWDYTWTNFGDFSIMTNVVS